ncbi:MAG TPA: NAD(P)-dependent alcohol dehydrogenase [Thermoanaerobaculia bacterium]|nr:NAD(P)-dependent alcohol dehydrogenase [Thermoanaerobaculia bacterium]
MRVVEIAPAFGRENLRLAERPELWPGSGQVLLRMRAAALNFRDVLTVEGTYNRKQKLPLIPCSDGVGEVVAVGQGVSRVAVGDRVCPIFAQRWIAGEPTRERLRSTLGGPLDGTLAESMVLSEEGVVHVPEHLSDEAAAALPCAAVTAWSALVAEGGVTAGDVVLVQGTGGVSIFALQLARLLGCRVIVTSSSHEKLARAKELGAEAGIHYGEVPEWGDRAKELTGGVGVDHVVEVGGAGTLAQSLRAVRMGGRISLIGVLAGGKTELTLAAVFMQRIRLQGILVGDRESFEAMNRAIAAHRLQPVIDRTFPLEETRAAFEHMAAGRHFGKICIRVG